MTACSRSSLLQPFRLGETILCQMCLVLQAGYGRSLSRHRLPGFETSLSTVHDLNLDDDFSEDILSE
jgi:hypothetical protein